MNRLLCAALFVGGLSACGCLGIKPVGPMAEVFPPAKPAAPTPAGPGVKVAAAKDGAAPALPPAPPPPAPALLVSPAEVTPDTAGEMADKLAQELDADRKAAEAMPRYSEVSVVTKK